LLPAAPRKPSVFACQTLSQKLDALFGSYVMARQRERHMDARGQSVARETGSRIEMF
jgi:hypothetical protein